VKWAARGLLKIQDAKKLPEICHLGTTAQLCPAISSQLRHVWTIGKKLVKQQYLLDMPTQYGELPYAIILLFSGADVNFPQKTSWHLIFIVCILCSKLSLLTSRWDRSFFFIQGGNLMNQLKDEVSSMCISDVTVFISYWAVCHIIDVTQCYVWRWKRQDYSFASVHDDSI